MLGKSSRNARFSSKPRLIALEVVRRQNEQTFDPLRIDEQPDVPVLLPITDYSLPRLLAVQRRIRCGVDGNRTYQIIFYILAYTNYYCYYIYLYIYILYSRVWEYWEFSVKNQRRDLQQLCPRDAAETEASGNRVSRL